MPGSLWWREIKTLPTRACLPVPRPRAYTRKAPDHLSITLLSCARPRISRCRAEKRPASILLQLPRARVFFGNLQDGVIDPSKLRARQLDPAAVALNSIRPLGGVYRQRERYPSEGPKVVARGDSVTGPRSLPCLEFFLALSRTCPRFEPTSTAIP